ncbi:MAG: helix-turn-helix domain-containing protein [Chloroflexota bacterium]
MTTVDTSYHERQRNARMQDPEIRREYELARAQIEQVDAIMRQLDELRAEMGLSKAQLARAIGKNPAALRRLFGAEVNPELKTVAALASALGAEIRVVPRKHGRYTSKKDPTGVA